MIEDALQAWTLGFRRYYLLNKIVQSSLICSEVNPLDSIFYTFDFLCSTDCFIYTMAVPIMVGMNRIFIL